MALIIKLNRDYFFKALLISLILLNATIYFIQSDLQKNSATKKNLSKKDIQLLTPEQSEKINYLSIINKTGEIEFLKESPSPFPWLMPAHGNILAETKKIKSLIQNLRMITTKRLIKADVISLKNYSLDTPFASVSYLVSGSPLATLKIGLINDVKKIAYLKYDNSEFIQEVSYKNLTDLGFNFSSYANSNPFGFSLKKFNTISLFKGGRKKVELKQIDNEWAISDLKKPKPEKRDKEQKWVNDLSLTKAIYILDKRTQETEERMEKSKKPWKEFKIVFSESSGQIYEYYIYPINNLEIAGNVDKTHYVLFDKFRPHPIILDNKIKKLLSVSKRSFK